MPERVREPSAALPFQMRCCCSDRRSGYRTPVSGPGFLRGRPGAAVRRKAETNLPSEAEKSSSPPRFVTDNRVVLRDDAASDGQGDSPNPDSISDVYGTGAVSEVGKERFFCQRMT